MLFGKNLNSLAGSLMSGFDSLVLSAEDLDNIPIGPGMREEWTSEGSEQSLDRLDSKAGSLLTHISMMIAAASFMVTSENSSNLERIVIGAEITAYLFLALICLRCLVYRDFIDHKLNSGTNVEDYKMHTRSEVKRRAQLLNFSLRWVFFITFIFALSVFVHLVL